MPQFASAVSLRIPLDGTVTSCHGMGQKKRSLDQSDDMILHSFSSAVISIIRMLNTSFCGATNALWLVCEFTKDTFNPVPNTIFPLQYFASGDEPFEFFLLKQPVLLHTLG